MQLEISLIPKHWWIERASIYTRPDVTCRAMVRFETDDERKIKVEREELFPTIDEAVAWIKEQLA